MKIYKESRKFMKLVTMLGMRECLVLLMGLSPVGDIFQRNVESVMEDVSPRPLVAHIDDILSEKGSFGAYAETLDIIMTRIEEKGVRINLIQSNIFQKEKRTCRFCISP